MTVSESSSVFEPSSLATAAMPRDAERDEFSELDTSTGSRRLSYVSLHEHMLRHSLRRTLRMRDYRTASSIVCGWACNWLAFAALLSLFVLYGCEFRSALSAKAAASSVAAASVGEALMLSWAWSVAQRFLINEPILIGLAKGLPILFSSAFCANCCTESCANTLSLLTELVASMCKVLTRGV